MGRRTIVIETRGDICMSDRDNPRKYLQDRAVVWYDLYEA